MDIQRIISLLMMSALCACSNMPRQKILDNAYYLNVPVHINLSGDHLMELPVLNDPQPKEVASYFIANIDENIVPIPPVEGWRCGFVSMSIPLQYWGDLKGREHIIFTYLSSYLTWIPIEGKVYRHTLYRLGDYEKAKRSRESKNLWPRPTQNYSF